jgi:multidrug efflux pump subunit AcrA (membrane-fusion protein)
MSALDDSANIKGKKLAGRVTVIFLAIMFALTFFSRTINNFTLPKVTCVNPGNGALIKEVTGTGSVETNITRELYVSSSMKVTGVSVEVGDSVKQGQTLMTLDTSDIERQMEDEQDKYAQKKLQLEELVEAGSPSSLISLDKAVQVARQNMGKAQKNYDSSKALFEAGAITSISLADAEADLENAKLDY